MPRQISRTKSKEWIWKCQGVLIIHFCANPCPAIQKTIIIQYQKSECFSAPPNPSSWRHSAHMLWCFRHITYKILCALLPAHFKCGIALGCVQSVVKNEDWNREHEQNHHAVQVCALKTQIWMRIGRSFPTFIVVVIMPIAEVLWFGACARWRRLVGDSLVIRCQTEMSMYII